MVRRAELEPLIIQEWLKRPEIDRTEDEILLFYGELSQKRPDLLSFRTNADKYQMLKSVLRNYIVKK